MATGGSDLTATSDEIIRIKCCLCAERNRKREAKKYCIDCKDYYCSPCVGVHKTIPFMKGHQILDKADFKTVGPDDSLPSYPVQRCKEHTTELLSIYCEDHDEVVCAQCIAFSHRSCKKIISIPEEIEGLHRNVNPSDIKLKLRKMSKTLEDIKSSREAELKALNKRFDEEVTSVKAFKQQLKELLEAAEKGTIRELRNKYDTIKTAVSKDIETIECLEKSLCESIEQFQKFEGNMTQEFVSTKCSEKLAVRAKELENTLKDKPLSSCQFIPNMDTKEFLRRNKYLGKVSLCIENTKLISCIKDGIYKGKKEKEINVQLQNDTNISYTCGSCITEDGFLLLTDSSNNKLKRVDLNRETVGDYIELQAKPYTVCTVSRTEAAVTLGCNYSVVLVSLGDKMTATRTLNMNHYCFGIACIDDKLYVSDYRRTLYVHDMDGRLIQNICQDANGRDIFSFNQHIAVSVDRDKVFVTDWNNGLVVLDSQGNYLTTLTDNRINGYCGMCTDGSNVFVSGYRSKNMVQISPDLNTLGVVENICRVLSLCFDVRKARLVATKENSNNITVWEMN